MVLPLLNTCAASVTTSLPWPRQWPQANDPDILVRAVSEGRILVTNDKDFGDLVFRSGQAHHGVVLLRLHDESATHRVRVLKSILKLHAHRLAGHFTVATEAGIRIRPASGLL